MNHAPAGLDTRRTPLAEARHTQRIAFAVICACGLALNLLLASCLLQ